VGAQLLSQQSLDCAGKPHTFVDNRASSVTRPCVPDHNAQGIDQGTQICTRSSAVKLSRQAHCTTRVGLAPDTMDHGRRLRQLVMNVAGAFTSPPPSTVRPRWSSLGGLPGEVIFAPFSYTSKTQQPGQTQNRKLKSEDRSRTVSTILVTGINQIQNLATVKFVNLD
jgi:hypothetical protein